MAKQKSPRIAFPVGTAVHPRLQKPDTKFDELGIYKADITLPRAVAKPIMDELQVIHKAHCGKAAKASENTMWMMETDEAGEETGNVHFKIRVKNKMTKKGELWDRRPLQFDAAGQAIKDPVNPWGGSKMAVNVEAYGWDTGSKQGISLQPIAVQIVEMVEGSGPSASAMGFAAQEGYTASTTPAYSDSAPDEDDQSDDEPVDDATDY